MEELATIYTAISQVTFSLETRDQSHNNAFLDEVCAVVTELLRRTPAGAATLAELAAQPTDPVRQAAARLALRDAVSRDSHALEALDAAVLAYVDNPPDDPAVRSTETFTEARRRRQLLESMELVNDQGSALYLQISTIARYLAILCPHSHRDIRKIDTVYVDSEEPAASVVLCDDGSSLIVVQRKVVEWLSFQAQLVWLAGASEDRTGCSSTRSGRLTLQAIFAALIRSRVIDWRFGAFPGSLTLQIDEAISNAELTFDPDLALYSGMFVLAHEIAHCALGHASAERSLVGWKRPVQVVHVTEDSEFAADRLAATVLSRFAQSRPGGRRSKRTEYYKAWLGGVAAAAAIAFWEDGAFLRLSRSHPPGSDRFTRVRQVFAERWSRSRRLHLAALDTLVRAGGLGAVLTGGVATIPLPEAAWTAAISMPCLVDYERARLAVAARVDEVVCGRAQLSGLETMPGLSPTALPLPTGASKAELASYFSRIGVPPERRKHLLDDTQPLMYSTAVDYVSSAPAFSAVESGAMRRALAYTVVVRNLASFSMENPYGHASR